MNISKMDLGEEFKLTWVEPSRNAIPVTALAPNLEASGDVILLATTEEPETIIREPEQSTQVTEEEEKDDGAEKSWKR